MNINACGEFYVPRRLDSFIRERTSYVRREILEFLSKGNIRINDCIECDPRRLIFEQDQVQVHKNLLASPNPRVVYAFHKPKGRISAHHSQIGKANIGSFLLEMGNDITHIGRLDRETTGLLLATNDGDLLHALTEPKFKSPKKYLLTVQGSYTKKDASIEALANPIINRNLKKEVVYHAKNIRITGSSDLKTRIEVTLVEGKNRQIRRMAAIVGLKLLHLHRFEVGGILLDGLVAGEYRVLDNLEIERLYLPFGGLQGFTHLRAQALQSLLKKKAFLPEIETSVRRWEEKYLDQLRTCHLGE